MPVLTRAVYKTVRNFAEYYDLKPSTAYKMVNEEDFPKIKVGQKGIRVDMTRVAEWLAQKYE